MKREYNMRQEGTPYALQSGFARLGEGDMKHELDGCGVKADCRSLSAAHWPSDCGRYGLVFSPKLLRIDTEIKDLFSLGHSHG
jgi:hypothetical protein